MPVKTAPLATLAFLVTLWVVSLVLGDLLSEGLGKVIATLKGRSPLATTPNIRPVAVRVSQRSRQQRALRAQPRLRAAA
jgi:hypothetical protein